MKKKVIMLESEEIDTSNNSDINDTCKNLYLSEKEREERLFQSIQSEKGLNGSDWSKKGRLWQ